MALGVLIPAFFIIWNLFRQLRRYLAYRPDAQDRIFRLLDYASAGALGHGPIHLLIQSADELWFGSGILSRPVGFGLAFSRCV